MLSEKRLFHRGIIVLLIAALLAGSCLTPQASAEKQDDLVVPIDSACFFSMKDGTVCINKICSGKQEIFDLFLRFANAKVEKFAIPYYENTDGVESRSCLIAELLDIQDGELLEDIVYMSNISAAAEVMDGVRLLVCDMWYYVSAEEDKCVKPFAEELVRTHITNDMDDYEKAYTLCSWINRHVSYGSCDHGSNRHKQSPYGVFIENKATCVGFASAVAYLMDLAGVPCKIVHNERHAWNAIRIDDAWYYADMSSGWCFLAGRETLRRAGYHKPLGRYEAFAAAVSDSDYKR